MPPAPLHDELPDSAPALPAAMLTARGDTAAEAALLARMGAGDHSALTALYSLYSDALYSLALRMTGEPRDAEEVLQDAFVKIWQRARGFDPEKSRPFTWAVMITRSHAIDRLRRRDVRRRAQNSLEKESANGAAHCEDSLSEIYFYETASRIRRGMARLTDNERRCVEAAVFDSTGTMELATLLNVPPGTAKSWLHRGLSKLRTWMTDENE